MKNQMLGRHSLEYFKEYDIDGTTIVLADEGYEDDEGFMKSWWSFGFWADEKTYHRVANIDGLGSFCSIGKARSVFEQKLTELFSTDKRTINETLMA